ILTGEILDDSGETANVKIGAMSLQLPRRGVGQGAVKLAVRPDAIALDATSTADGKALGTVRKASYLGTQTEYEVDSPIGELFVVQYGRKDPIAPGTSVSISFAEQRGIAIIPRA